MSICLNRLDLFDDDDNPDSYYQGHKASGYVDCYKRRHEREENPYPPGSYLFARWDLGYTHGVEEDEDNKQLERESHWSE